MREEATTSVTPLKRYAFFGFAVAFAGPPVYIHLPKLYAEQHGLSLAVIGGVLLAIRTVDFVQDPLLGWGIARWQRWRPQLASGFAILLAVSMVLLFAVEPEDHPVAWLVGCLIGVFTGFSGLQIIYYSSGIGLAQNLSGGHERVASWREASVLAGICVACVAPTVFGYWSGDELVAYAIYAIAFAGLLAVAAALAMPIWALTGQAGTDHSFYFLLQDKTIRTLLILGFVNALPAALTATLFFFFVEYRLEAGGHAGPMLLVFFLSAATFAPVWGQAAQVVGAKTAVLSGMILAIVSFAFAWWLGPGDWLQFYGIAAFSGAAVSADMTLLPAMLAVRVAQTGGGREQAFGLWGFINKSTFAIAAGAALPALSYAGFEPGKANSDFALSALAFAYAAVPCLLKFAAIGMLCAMTIESEEAA